MVKRTKSIDYLDEDVAYLLGLIVARGQVLEAGNDRRITIEFPFVNLQVKGIKKSYEQSKELLAGVQASRRRISELTDTNIDETETQHSVILTITCHKNTMFWRDIRLVTNQKSSYLEFEIPEVIYGAPRSVKREFLRGFADVAGSTRAANRDQRGKHRIYLDVLNQNWKLPVQLCHLLQDHLKVPVQTITYGHPNIRDPELKEYNAGKHEAWAREHQVKIYADDFTGIGFYMPHKNEILKELSDFNKKNFKKSSFCKPPKDVRPKPRHPEEKSKKLPKELRGNHYGSYWQICLDLGCPRQAKCLPQFRPYMPSVQTSLHT